MDIICFQYSGPSEAPNRGGNGNERTESHSAHRSQGQPESNEQDKITSRLIMRIYTRCDRSSGCLHRRSLPRRSFSGNRGRSNGGGGQRSVFGRAMETAKRSSSGGDRPPEPPAKRRRAVRNDATSWADLNPELIGRVSRFLAMGNPDLMNFCSAVGPSTSAAVRKAYLVDNDYYLDYCFTHDPSGNKTSCWLEHNEVEWKKRCQGVERQCPCHIHHAGRCSKIGTELTRPLHVLLSDDQPLLNRYRRVFAPFLQRSSY